MSKTMTLPGYEDFGELKEKHLRKRREEPDDTGRTFRWDNQTWTVVSVRQVGKGQFSYEVYYAAPHLEDGSLGKMQTFDPHRVALL